MKKTQQKNLLYILIPSTILIVLWIISTVYNTAVMSTISKSQQVAVQSISPKFPTDVLKDLRKRTTIDPLLSIEDVPNTSASDEASLITSPTPTPDTSLQQVATGGGAVEGTP